MSCLLRLSILVLATTSALSSDDWLAKFERECRAKGGTPEHYSSGGGKCVMPASSSSSSSSTYSTASNPYQPMVDGLLQWIFSTNNNAAQAKQRREAMMRELAAQREQARRNQQVAQAQRLDAIMQRLMGDSDLILKGMGNTDGLRLKLGEKRPLGMEVYQHPNDGKKRMGISGLSGINLDNETPTTTRAQLTLKLGDDATRSLQSPPPPATPPADPGKDPAAAEPTRAEQNEAKSQIDDLARTISQLSPEEQQKLLAALQKSDAAAASPTPEPAPSGSAPDPNAGLSLKLSGARSEAEKLQAAAASDASPEQLKTQAEDQFRNLQGITADPIKIGQSPELGIPAPPGQASPGTSVPPPPTPTAARAPQASQPDCSRLGSADPSVVDLRCARTNVPSLPGVSRASGPASGVTRNNVEPVSPTLLAEFSSGTFSPLLENGSPIFNARPPESQLHGLVGGTTWTYGFRWPQAHCDEECRKSMKPQLDRQLALFCQSQQDPPACIKAGLPFTPELYDLVVSMGSSHAAIEDLATRVLFDGATYGEFSRQHKEIFASLKGRDFAQLDCHSNGAMLCLAALRSGDTHAKEVRLFGPQMNPEAAQRWQEYAANTGTTIKVYINNGDPIPAASWKQPTPQTPAGVAATAVWLTNPVTGPAAFSDALFYTFLDSKVPLMDNALKNYGFEVKRFANDDPGCTGAPSIGCHSMKLYEKHVK
ncbi:MAG TPA: hypothetical protein VMZ25_01325 [Terriglobales bacterium]|nr:hypothetical protein [Terriglobales bacterium]